MAEPMLLAYNLNSLKEAGLSALCQRLGIRLRTVQREEYTLPVGALAGLPIKGDGNTASLSAFDDEMLVMCHMLSDQLDAFLQGLRGSGLPGIPLKAVLTPTNVTWSSVQLHDELASEHAAMTRRSRP